MRFICPVIVLLSVFVLNATSFAERDPFAPLQKTPAREFEFGWPAKCLAGTIGADLWTTANWEPAGHLRRAQNLHVLYRGLVVNIIVVVAILLSTFNICARLQRDFQPRFSIATLLGITLFVSFEMWTRQLIAVPVRTQLSNMLVDYSDLVVRAAILLSCVYYPNLIAAKLGTNRASLNAGEH